MNKKIAAQWAQLIENYGDSAYLMIAARYGFDYDKFTDFGNNQEVDDAILMGVPEFKFKDSAALPFCLERAKAGDVVEWRAQNGEWVEITDFKASYRADYAHSGNYLGVSISFYHAGNLRMKYPPKSKGNGVNEICFKTIVEKCPTCGGDALNRSEFWEAVPENGAELEKKLYAAEKAIKRYYLALDRRQHGGVAQDKAFSDIEKALGMNWKQGEMLKEIADNPRLGKIYDDQ